MTPETYYTIRRIQSACGVRSEVLFDLTYRRVWRPELSDEGQWCDFLVEQIEIEAGRSITRQAMCHERQPSEDEDMDSDGQHGQTSKP
jgi:hypothetical protein